MREPADATPRTSGPVGVGRLAGTLLVQRDLAVLLGHVGGVGLERVVECGRSVQVRIVDRLLLLGHVGGVGLEAVTGANAVDGDGRHAHLVPARQRFLAIWPEIAQRVHVQLCGQRTRTRPARRGTMCPHEARARRPGRRPPLVGPNPRRARRRPGGRQRGVGHGRVGPRSVLEQALGLPGGMVHPGLLRGGASGARTTT
jgi:hypothetical protein